jgi:hypothetical protein
MVMEETTVSCEIRGVSLDQFKQELTSLLAELKDGPSLRDEVQRWGVDPESFADIDPNRAVSIEVAQKPGLAAEVTFLLLKFTLPVAAKITIDLWRMFLKRRLQQRLGRDAVQ